MAFRKELPKALEGHWSNPSFARWIIAYTLPDHVNRGAGTGDEEVQKMAKSQPSNPFHTTHIERKGPQKSPSLADALSAELASLKGMRQCLGSPSNHKLPV
ncbi:hypothetical protein MMC19_007462 [Ptychographa xylographoides]|nr:hypothetical protein [Ptychographa xylographoides]